MSQSSYPIELDIENPDVELSDDAIEALARLLVDAAIDEKKEDKK